MKMRLALLSLLTLLCLTLFIVPAVADNVDIYLISTNGPLNGYKYAWQINQGHVVSDTFTVTSGAIVTSFDFGVWVAMGDTPLTVDWSISATENGIGIGGTANLSSSKLIPDNGTTHDGNLNGSHFAVFDATVQTGGVPLNAGTYWLNLQNLTTVNGGFAGWDENDGPAFASESSIGVIPSEDPDIYGYGTTPEPSSIALFGSGILGLAGVLRRRIRV